METIDAEKNIKLKPLVLSFNLSCWQNRRARLYFDGIDLFESKGDSYLNINIPTDLVLEMRKIGKKIEFMDRTVNIYSPGKECKTYFQLQVWKHEGKKKCLFGDDDGDDGEPTLRLEKIGVNKNKLYCTIDCDKGLKVQKLFLIGILVMNDTIYISEETFFPPPSSKRKIGNTIPKSIPNEIGGPSHPYHDSWLKMSKIFDNLGVSESFYHLTRAIEFTSDFEGRELNTCKKDLIDWLNFGPFTLSEKIEYGIVDSIVSLWKSGYFFASVSSANSNKLLKDIHQRTGECLFLIRFSMARKPFFDLEGIYNDMTIPTEPTFYKALIMYEIDVTSKKVFYWLNTRNDKKPSGSHSLINILSYVSRTTMWKPVSTDFYDKGGLPSISEQNTITHQNTSQVHFSNFEHRNKSPFVVTSMNTIHSSDHYEHSSMTTLGNFHQDQPVQQVFLVGSPNFNTLKNPLGNWQHSNHNDVL